jgi:DNA-binding beta-propeller fold protein YncE
MLALAWPAVAADEPGAGDSLVTEGFGAGRTEINLRFVAELGRSGNGPGEFRRPLVLALAPAGGFLVTDAGNSRVQYLDEAGRFRWEAGGAGTDEGTLERPVAIAASGLEILVLDTGRKQVLQFHARGEYLGVVLAFTAPDVERRVGEVDPRGIALDRSGNLIVTDREGDRLLVFAANRDLLYEAGGFGDGAQQFEDPEGVVTSATRIFVADSGNGRVQVLNPQGRFQESWPLPGGGRPAGLATDAEGRLLVTDAGRSRVLVFDAKGHVIAEAGVAGAGPAELSGPAGVCALDKGQVIVADSENDRLVQFVLTQHQVSP